MDNEPWLALLRQTPEDVQYMKSLYDFDFDTTGKEKLEAIDQWMKGESHLLEASKHMPRQYLQTLYFLAKCSTEATKQKIDKLLTLKTLMPELFNYRSLDEFEDYAKHVLHTILPQPCPSDRSRLTVVKVLLDNLDRIDIVNFFRYAFMIAEYRISFDLTIHERIVIDISRISPLALVQHFNPILIKKGDLISATVGIKIKGIHIITASTYIDKIVAILKQTLRPKVAGRLHVHPTYEDLHKHIPKEILPSDFGGDEVSLETIAAQWKKEFQTPRSIQLLEQFSKIASDESKRSNYKFNEEYLGIPGSFRKLSVD